MDPGAVRAEWNIRSQLGESAVTTSVELRWVVWRVRRLHLEEQELDDDRGNAEGVPHSASLRNGLADNEPQGADRLRGHPPMGRRVGT